MALLTFHLICFTEFAQDYEAQYTMGWSFIIILSLQLISNLIFLVYVIIRDLSLIITFAYRWLKQKCCKPKPIIIAEEVLEPEEKIWY